MSKLVIAGGNGFLGGILTKHFLKSFEEIVILTRQPQTPNEKIRHAPWDAKTLGDWKDELNNCDVLINLTGKNVNCRYTEKNKTEILNSRTDATKILGEAIRAAENPPKLWLQASSSTIYNHAYELNDESSNNIGDDFSMTVCKQWERAYWEEICPATKKVVMRIAIVLGNDGGALPTIKQLAQLGLGGQQGNGTQIISWIHESDFVRVAEWLIKHGKPNGVYNVCAPTPVCNKAFMKTLRLAMGVSVGLPIPAWMLTIGAAVMRTETELVLKSRCVKPGNLLCEGFQFQKPTLGDALATLC